MYFIAFILLFGFGILWVVIESAVYQFRHRKAIKRRNQYPREVEELLERFEIEQEVWKKHYEKYRVSDLFKDINNNDTSKI